MGCSTPLNCTLVGQCGTAYRASASKESACVSTAPVFGSADGAPKSADPGWWALVHHNAGGRHPGDNSALGQTLIWCAWLGALCATALIQQFWVFVVAVCALVVLVIFLPDDLSSPYYIHVVLPIIASVGFCGSHWAFSMFYFIFGIVPLADYILGVDVANQPKDAQKTLHRAFRFKLFTLLVPVFVAANLIAGAWFVTRGAGANLTTLEFVGFSLSVGFYSYDVAGRELPKQIGSSVFWVAFSCARRATGTFTSNIRWGYKDVCTARMRDGAGENFTLSCLGTFWELAFSAIKAAPAKRARLVAERNQCTSLGRNGARSPRRVRRHSAQLLSDSGRVGHCSPSRSYLEHYGLERRRLPDGKHETVRPCHSWDSPARLTNMVTIKLQRHADHHAHAGKRFQTLQAYEESPQLPSGYATMIVLAFFPPLWRYVMHPRLMRFRKTQTGQVWRHGPQPVYSKSE